MSSPKPKTETTKRVRRSSAEATIELITKTRKRLAANVERASNAARAANMAYEAAKAEQREFEDTLNPPIDAEFKEVEEEPS